MALDVKFSYVCPRKFAELRGEGNLSRYCDECRLEVHNLDPLNDHQRLAFFERIVASGEQVCVAATVPLENARPCSVPAWKRMHIPMPVVPAGRPPEMLAGRIAPPGREQLERERERLQGTKPKKD